MSRVKFKCPNCGCKTLHEKISHAEVSRNIKGVTTNTFAGRSWPHSRRDRLLPVRLHVLLYTTSNKIEPQGNTVVNYMCGKKGCRFVVPAHTPAELTLWLHDNDMLLSHSGHVFPGNYIHGTGFIVVEQLFIAEMVKQGQLSAQFMNNRKKHVQAPQSGPYKPPVHAPQPQAVFKP